MEYMGGFGFTKGDFTNGTDPEGSIVMIVVGGSSFGGLAEGPAWSGEGGGGGGVEVG